ncbi:hypothetical protein Hdeb2414_s0020g00558861 [Helianthus debilis subsp. tardiflorus]
MRLAQFRAMFGNRVMIQDKLLWSKFLNSYSRVIPRISIRKTVDDDEMKEVARCLDTHFRR